MAAAGDRADSSFQLPPCSGSRHCQRWGLAGLSSLRRLCSLSVLPGDLMQGNVLASAELE